MQAILEDINPGPNRSFASFRYRWRTLDDPIGWHLHPEYEISYFVRARGSIYVGDSVFPLAAGDLQLLGPNMPHAYVENRHDEEEFEVIVIHFNPERILHPQSAMPEFASIKELLRKAERGLAFQTIDSPQRRQLLADTVTGDSLSRYTALLDLLNHLGGDDSCRPLASEGFAVEATNFDEQRMSNVMNYVRQNLSGEIVQGDLAAELGMSASNFSRFFRNASGRTFVSFLNMVRISEACQKLLHTDRDITDIAYECGYRSLTNFNRRFRDLRGVTPSEYRKHRTLPAQTTNER